METILFLAKGDLRNSASTLTYSTQESSNSSLRSLLLSGKNRVCGHNCDGGKALDLWVDLVLPRGDVELATGFKVFVFRS